jgi:hypothetical protein
MPERIVEYELDGVFEGMLNGSTSRGAGDNDGFARHFCVQDYGQKRATNKKEIRDVD